jgi:ribonuclease HII
VTKASSSAARTSPTFLELCAEAYRLRLLRSFEDRLARCGFARIAGVDEAGRGCLAGPVVAAAVIVDPWVLVPGVDDSKELSPEERERLAGEIRRTSRAYCVCSISADVIDRVNILEATRLAMRGALAGLAPAPDCAVIDALFLSGLAYPCLPVVRGDSLSYAVACASILAKVERDRGMVALEEHHPGYGFAAHKGYGVPEHVAALDRLGPSPVHRMTFRRVRPELDPELELEDPPPARLLRTSRKSSLRLALEGAC